MKKLIAGTWTSGTFDEDKFGKALLLFRNAPRSGGASPAQLVFKRPVRDCLPAHRRSFAPEWQKAADVLEKRSRRATELRAEHFNRRARPLPALAVGNKVLIQHPITKCWATPGIITEIGPNRDYLVKTAAGRVFRRNRRLLRRLIPVMPSSSAGTQPIQPPPAAVQPPGPAENPPAQTQPAPAPEPPARRSGRVPKPSNKYPNETWTK